MRRRFWLLRGWKFWVNPLKKKICDKSLFQMLNEVLKSFLKMISADIKADAKQEIKELVAASSQKYLPKT